MKKLLLLLSLLTACHIAPPKQVKPNLEEELAGLSEIPLTNMPGHAPPECPLECICPNWFGLSKSPCDPCHEKERTPVVWYDETNFLDALMAAALENKLLLVVLAEPQDSMGRSLTNQLAKRFRSSQCVQDELRKSYVPVLVTYSAYNKLRKTHLKPVGWLPGDNIQTPALLFLKIKDYGGHKYGAYALPITYEGRIDTDLCTILQGFSEAAK